MVQYCQYPCIHKPTKRLGRLQCCLGHKSTPSTSLICIMQILLSSADVLSGSVGYELHPTYKKTGQTNQYNRWTAAVGRSSLFMIKCMNQPTNIPAARVEFVQTNVFVPVSCGSIPTSAISFMAKSCKLLTCERYQCIFLRYRLSNDGHIACLPRYRLPL